MAQATAGGVALVAILAVCAAVRTDADHGPEPVVVLHVIDEMSVRLGVLADAEQLTMRIYQGAGVRTVWTHGAASTIQANDALRVDVVLRSKDMRTVTSRSEVVDGEVLGMASPPLLRADIFCEHVFDYARMTGSDVGRLLGAVIAHEVGHLLLAVLTHAPSGLMRAQWDGPIVRVPGFTVDEGRAIRTRLATMSAR